VLLVGVIAAGTALPAENRANYQTPGAESTRAYELLGGRFGSALAMGLPLITALFGLGIGATLGGIATRFLETPDWAPTVAGMIGLGVGIDYALFIITRYRQSLGDGLEPREAVITAMGTAGRAVLFAGGTVVISLVGMLTMGLGYLQGEAGSAVLAVLVMLGAGHPQPGR